MNIRRILLSVLVFIFVLTGAAYIFRTPLVLAVGKKLAAHRMAADPVAALPDGLHVGLCGSGSPFPDDKRTGPCTIVIAGKRVFVFDAGSGSVRNIGKMGIAHGRIEAIFLTHFHSDHIDGLGELLLQRWASARNTVPVPIYGTTGVETVVAGIMQAYQQDQGYRVAHHGDDTVPASGFGGIAKPYAIGAQDSVVMLKDADLEITAFAVDHAPVHPAIGYRIRYKDRSLVLSGDTKKAASVQRESAGVDVLVHEALSTKLVDVLVQGAAAAGRPNLNKIFKDINDYHTTPGQAAEIARDAKVGYLLLNHIVPALPLPGMEQAFLGDAPAIFSGPIRVGNDGDFLSLPAGSKEIKLRQMF
jgi:ribonuclease Z